jgi:hypothetical protein
MIHTPQQYWVEPNLIIKGDRESIQPKSLRISQREHEMGGQVCTFQEIPVGVVYKIVLYCGVIERHILRFVCKQLHQISHKCSSTQEDIFFCALRFVDPIQKKNSFFCLIAEQGYLNILKWASQNFSTIFDLHKTNCCHSAAREGHLEVLEWIMNNGCFWDSSICCSTAKEGHLEILKWARKNNYALDVRTCYHAAKGGHLEIIKWARGKNCPWDERVCSEAASGGYLEILKWARESGCPWNGKVCSNAALGGHLEMLKRYAQR